MFRSYLLLPDHLPPPRFGPLAGALEPARVRLTRRLEGALGRLAVVNYGETRSRLAHLNGLEEDACGPEESALADRLAHELSHYLDDLESANDSWLSLQALAAYSRGLPPADVKRELTDHGWPVHADVTARLCWIQEQAARMTTGVAFTAPFQCEVSERNIPGRTVDREHHQLIAYLHGLAMHIGERLIPLSKGETPDFTLTDDSGSCLVGAEMAEAPVSGKWAEEQDVAAVVTDALQRWLAPARRNILIDEPCAWALWRDEAAGSFCAAQIQGRADRPSRIWNGLDSRSEGAGSR